MSGSPVGSLPGATVSARKLQLHLKLLDTDRLEELKAALLEASVFPGSSRVAVFDHDALAAVGGERPPEAFGSLDGYLELGIAAGADDTPLLDAAAALRERVAGLIDASASAAVLGDETVIREGDGEFQLFRAIRRWPGLAADQFAYHLYFVHSLYGRLSPGRPGYRFLFSDPDASVRAAQSAGVAIDDVDAVAQLIRTRELTFDPPPQQAGLQEATLTDGALIVDRPRCFGGTAAHVVAVND